MVDGRLSILLLVLFATHCSAEFYWRYKGLHPSFDDPYNVPSEAQLAAEGLGFEDDDPAFEPNGFDIPIRECGYRIFKHVIQYLTCYDVGFCECDPSAPITRTVVADVDPSGDPNTGVYFTPETCLIAPNWVTAASDGMEYRMAHRHVYEDNRFQQHDIKGVSSDTNRFLFQWPGKWKAVCADIITWKITETATGATDKFQAVLTYGNDGKTYVYYLYESVGTFPTINPVRGILNGEYIGGSADVEAARICPSTLGSNNMATNEEFTHNSNYNCGREGVYLLRTEDGDECKGIDTCVTYENEVKPSCNHSRIPQDTCTESVKCRLSEDGDIILDIGLRWYRWRSLKALDYIEFIGEANGGSVDKPRGVEISVGPNDKCRKDDLPHPGEDDPTWAIYTLTMPEDSDPGECGTVIDTDAKTVKFAFKNYDYDPAIHSTDVNADVSQGDDVVLHGACHYLDTPSRVSADINFNPPPPPTIMAPRSRSFTFDVVDSDSAGGIVLTKVKVGRDIYLRICFYPGTPYNRNADPYGIYVIECLAGNNVNFVNNLGSYHRRQTIIENGCPANEQGAIYLTRAFQADMAFSSYDGSGWCILTGKIDAAKWYVLNADGAPVTDMHFKCVARFCDIEDGTGFGQGFEQQKCIDNCEADNTKRRRRSDEDFKAPTETLTTSVTLIGPDNPSKAPQEDNASSTGTIVTTIVAVAMVTVAIGICILLFLKLKTKRRIQKEHIKFKEEYQNNYI